jgi:sugar lactone lactonase YvrE
MDTSGNIIRTTGGYGWVESTFDEPVDVFATPLNVYVVDKNNHRIQRFDRDLNYISSLSTRDDNNDASRFGYPNSCTVSNQGDLYILDTENQRVVKFDLFGNFIQNFGGYDSGNYQLRKPKSIAVSPYNRIYVLDETGVLIFDAFGNGVGRIEIEGKPASLRIIFEMLTINSKNKVYITNLRSEENLMREIEFTDVQIQEIVSSLSYLGKLYVLTKKEILIFSLTN